MYEIGSPLNPVYFPEFESCFKNRLDVIVGCVDTNFRQCFYTTDLLTFQLRRDLSDPVLTDYVTVIEIAGQDPILFSPSNTTDVGGIRIFDYTIDLSPYEGDEFCIGVFYASGSLELTHLSTSWPIKVLSPPPNHECDGLFLIEYTDCGAGIGGHYFGSVSGDRNYSFRIPLAIESGMWASSIASFFASTGSGSVCNSTHEKTLQMGTYEFIPEWLAIKIQLAATLNGFHIEGTRYFLNSDALKGQGNGFGLYNFEFSFKLATQLSKSACCT